MSAPMRLELLRKRRRRRMLVVMAGDALAWLGILALVWILLLAMYGWL